jgi:hypothetical protein
MRAAAMAAVAAPDTTQAAASNVDAAASLLIECPAVASIDMHGTCLPGSSSSSLQQLLTQGAAVQAARQPYHQHHDQHLLHSQPLACSPHRLTNSLAAAGTKSASTSDITSMGAATTKSAQLVGGSARLHELPGTGQGCSRHTRC